MFYIDCTAEIKYIYINIYINKVYIYIIKLAGHKCLFFLFCSRGYGYRKMDGNSQRNHQGLCSCCFLQLFSGTFKMG